MKKIILLVMILFTVGSCKSTKVSESIIYFLPRAVEEELFKIISKQKEMDYCFYLLSKSEYKYEIFIIEDKLKNNFNTVNKYRYVDNTNRKLLVNDKFYPLIFATDYTFGTDLRKTKLKNLSERNQIDKKEDGYILYKIDVLLHGKSIIFDNKGNIYNN